MSRLSEGRGIAASGKTAAASERAKFETLMQLGDGQLDCDNRQEALSYYQQAMAMAPAVASPAETIFLCRRLGEAHQLRAEYDQARSALTEAERHLELHPDDTELGQVLAIRGAIATDTGRFSSAQHLLQRAYELLKQTPDQHALATTERRLGNLYVRMGRPQEARNYFESAYAIFRRLGDQREIAGTLNNLGIMHRMACEWLEAIRVMEKALVLNETLADEAKIGALCVNLGIVHHKLGQWMRAEERLDRAMVLMARIANRRGLASAYIARANLAIRQRRFAAAENWLGQALEVARAHGIVRAEGLAHQSLGDLAFARGDFARAEQELRAGLDVVATLDPANELVGELDRRLGEVCASTGRLDLAHTLAEESIRIARQVGDLYQEALCHRLLARVHGLRGEIEPFRQHATLVIERLSSMGDRWEQLRTLLALGDVWMREGRKLADRWMEEAQAVYQRAETLAVALALPGDIVLAALRLASLDRANGRLDQALVRIGAALHQIGDEESDLRQELITLRGEVENAIASGYGPIAAEREAFQEVTRLYGGSADVSAVLDSLLALVVRRSGSDRAFFAWGPDVAAGAGDGEAQKSHGRTEGRSRGRSTTGEGEADLVVQSRAGFRQSEARHILAGLGRPLIAELISTERPLIATEPDEDPRLAAVTERDSAPLSVAVLPFRISGQVQGLVYVERTPGNDAGPYRAAEIAFLAMLTNVVAIAAVESERARSLRAGVPAAELNPALAPVVTRNEEMLRILKLIERVAATPARLLFLGETGTGKGLLARAVHQLSPAAGEPFVPVNCAALPEPLLESELFGHVQGAFTGALREKRGLFEEAGAGTIFLDEIDKMSAAMQAKLLHVLDRQEVRMVGGTKGRTIRCRVISASNVDLGESIRRGDFLEDLYYRLNEFSVIVPPLRERPDDILLLAARFIEKSASRMGRHPRGLDPEVERALLAYEWPGNVRELEKTIERMVVLGEDGAPLDAELLPTPLAPAGENIKAGTTLREEVQRLEARLIGQVLRDNGWNKLRTARALHVSYPSLLKKIRDYKLDRRRGVNPASRSKTVNK